ncbi:MAG: bifunctional aconitate hydratase 2/2-methylisocitrate dehydratase [Planctomycetota bacterium]|jgi:aconitate hydratase 2/2-methylisocitrate dehydratase|nr:bifunctional aconitate hydratase 2/2-methylisocitrate dehydratase [Planctomycetota bacterium]
MSAAEKTDRPAGIPPMPLNAEQTAALCEKLTSASATACDAQALSERVPPGVAPAAKVKAEFLSAIATGAKKSAVIAPAPAVALLGSMYGGYNVSALIKLLASPLADEAAAALSQTILVFADFDAVAQLAQSGNRAAQKVLENWANAAWFTARPALPATMRLRVYKVSGVVTTDDLSPAKDAVTRPDIPLHALSLGGASFPDAIDFMADARRRGEKVAFAGDTVGVGSSRKSASNSLIWHIGDDIPFVPNKRRGGVVLGATIAPIFFNTFEDAGGLPLVCDVSRLTTGQLITVNFSTGKITGESGETLTTFNLQPATLPDEYRAGGRIPLIIGKALTAQAAAAVKGNYELRVTKDESLFTPAPAPKKIPAGWTLAQKIVGKACGKNGVAPGESCQPQITTVGSQDTTGPMTRDELTELACLQFAAPFVLQSFCHTAAYPQEKDKETHATLSQFFTERGGFALRPGDGIIHSWLNRLLLPDTVGTGGDSHTRFPLGISFAVGSGLAAFAAALGSMPLDMPESVLVKIVGQLPRGITWRDAVNYLPIRAVELGLQSEFGKGEKNVFNGRILEIEGLTRQMPVEEAFEWSCASAERSAAACTVDLAEDAVVAWLNDSVKIIDGLIAGGYQARVALEKRRASISEWLKKPALTRRDANAEFAATLELDVAQIREPALALPNNPDAAGWLSDHAGRALDEVFIGSCMTNREQFRAAAQILRGKKIAVNRLWITPPTRLDREVLEREGVWKVFADAGARLEIPGCSLCMGNQARVADDATVFSTSTRNFNNRMGDGAQVFLGSALLAAVAATLGRLPTKEEYFARVES